MVIYSNDTRPDPHGVLPVTIEVKRVEKPQFKTWIDKLQEQSRDTQTPVLAWRQNGKPWTIMPLLDESEWKVLIDNKTILELIQSALGPHIIEKNIMKLLKRIQELRLEVHTLKNQLREQGK
jgi:hypothetical protein